MGKRGKNPRQQQKHHRSHVFVAGGAEAEEDLLPSSAYDLPPDADTVGDEEEKEGQEEEREGVDNTEHVGCGLSKFDLYQKSVQLPKGDISYLQKFFLMYVGGRMPIHLQEDFCGTALLSSEWLRSDARRTAVGLDLDLEPLTWCLNNNVPKVGPDSYSRLFLFHGNVLQSQEACLVRSKFQELIKGVKFGGDEEVGSHMKDVTVTAASDSIIQASSSYPPSETILKKDYPLPARDIICAFNYSCCCLQKRVELVLYFSHVINALSKRGGIFVMDLYGGSSSEHKLQLKRRVSNFTYIWEQAEFDVISRRTKISIHFQLGKKQTLRHAFSYNWRLWSLPEIKDCLEEAGFQSVHFWIREMPDTRETSNLKEFNAAIDVKYEECSSFPQRDAWNAYIVGVVK